jgi:SAM-dependent methyltransferase
MRLMRDLQDFVPKGGAAIEIGVFKADFSKAFLQAFTPRKLVLIDPWATVTDDRHRHAWYHARSGQDMAAIHSQVLVDLAGPIAQGQVEVHRGRSEDALPSLPDGAFDLVYVDGDHLHDAVRYDLEQGFAKLKPGGLLLADDYGGKLTHWWGDDVQRAVDSFIAAQPGTALFRQVLRGRAYIQRAM